MNQLSLFERTVDDIPARHLAARNDPETSHEAARRLKKSGELNRQSELVLELLRSNPGCTSAEIAASTGCDYHMIARRLPELDEIGQAFRGKKRLCRVKHVFMQTWWPSKV